jgi:H+/Na+-translocating ferredoxin:NAD+ oxidoreductase subunit B
VVIWQNKVDDDLHLDKCMPVGFPATKSGVDLKILQRLFSPEDAEIALQLGPLPETLEEIYPRVEKSGITREELENQLDALVEKSVIMGGKLTAGQDSLKRYSLSQWAIGIYEFQVDRLSKGLAEDANNYLNEAFNP